MAGRISDAAADNAAFKGRGVPAGGSRGRRERCACVPLYCIGVLAAAALVWAALLSRAGVTAMAGRTGRPLYRGGDGTGAAFIFAVRWDSSALPALLEKLDEKGIKVTFAFSKEVIESAPQTVRETAARGHETALIAENGHETGEELAYLSGRVEELTGEPPVTLLCPSGAAEGLTARAEEAAQTGGAGAELLAEAAAAAQAGQEVDSSVWKAEHDRAAAKFNAALKLYRKFMGGKESEAGLLPQIEELAFEAAKLFEAVRDVSGGTAPRVEESINQCYRLISDCRRQSLEGGNGGDGGASGTGAGKPRSPGGSFLNQRQ